MTLAMKQTTTPSFNKTTTGFDYKSKSGGASTTNYGAWASAAGSVISGFFDAQIASTQAKAQKEIGEMDAKTMVHEAQIGRQRELEDRRYMEQGASAFREKYRGDRPVMAPALTDPTTVVVTDPFAKAPARVASPRPQPVRQA